ncbi:MAG TPA: hypothetical protein VGE76_13595 [Opitutaceae bacterium]
MNVRRAVAILALGGLVAASLLGWAWREARAGAALRQAITRETETQQRLRAELAAARKRLVAHAPAAPVASVTAAAPAPPQRVRPPSLSDAASENPQMWNDFIALKRVEYRGDYAAYFRRSGLTALQRERVLDILARGLTDSVDIGAAARARDMSFEDPLVEKLQQDVKRQTDAELAEYLGPARYAELERFQRTEQVRGFVDGLAVQVAEFAPLTAQQADRLADAIAAASPEFRAGKHAQAKTLEWPEIDRQAKTFLTPQQHAMWMRGSAHNPIGGSRRHLELSAAYQQAVAKAKGDG